MSRKRETQPDGFVIYRNSLNSIRLLPNESAGKVIRAAANLFLGCELAEDFDTAEKIVFSQLQADVDNSIARFSEICERNQKIAARRENHQRSVTTGDHSPRSVTTGDHSLPLATNRIESNQIESNQIEKSIGADKPHRTPRFIPPTVEEVTEYCSSRGNEVDAQKFVDHYTSNGWVVGKTKMKDWRAAVRTWESNDAARTSSTKITRTDADYDVSVLIGEE